MKKYIILLLIIVVSIYLSLNHTLIVSQTLPLNNHKIVLDPGHGSKDSGAKYGKIYESDLNLQISFALKKELESRGATVYLTRTDENDMTKRNYNYSKDDDMYLRAIQIDKYQADLFLSIHLNSSVSSAWGSQVFYYTGSDQGKVLASMIHTHMKELTGTKKEISSCHFKILRTTKTLGTLIECGFLSNSNERGQLVSRKYQKKLSKKIADGVEEYINTYLKTDLSGVL